jgi:hypothetical protein
VRTLAPVELNIMPVGLSLYPRHPCGERAVHGASSLPPFPGGVSCGPGRPPVPLWWRGPFMWAPRHLWVRPAPIIPVNDVAPWPWLRLQNCASNRSVWVRGQTLPSMVSPGGESSSETSPPWCLAFSDVRRESSLLEVPPPLPWLCAGSPM